MKYFLTILSLVIFGWEASVPLMYFAAQGHFSFWFILAAGVFGATVSDTVWYVVGRRITHERIGQIKYFKKRPHHFHAISKATESNGYLFLFSSKFLYGIGIPAHILSGAYRLSYLKSTLVNISGDVIWLSLVFVLARGTQAIPNLKKDLVVAQLAFGGFILIMVGVHFLVGRFMRKYFHLEPKDVEEDYTGGN